jgi:hypothetical protein
VTTTQVSLPAEAHADRAGLRVRVSTLWIVIGVALPAAASMAARLGTIDLAYQLRLGDAMWRSHALVRADAFTFTASGRPWVDQQWLAQLLLAAASRAGGWNGLVVLRTLLIGATFALVYLACRQRGAGRRAAALLALASFGGAMLGLALRPQLFAFALFALVAWAIASRDSHPGRLLVVPVAVALWANVHGSFFLGPLLVALAWVEDRRGPGAARLLFVAGLSLLASVLNPFGAGVWSYVVSISTNPAITHGITEWAPPTIRDAAGCAFFGSAAAIAALFARRRAPATWPMLLTLGVFFAIGLQSGRGMFWWDLIAPITIAPLFPRSRRDEELARPLPAVLVLAAVLAVAVAFLPWWRSGESPVALLNDAPPGLTAALARVAPPGSRVFDAQRLGSWIEWASPATPVFVDSRIELFSHREWADYDAVSDGVEGWGSILDRYAVDVIVAVPDQQAGLLTRLPTDPAWRLAYRDGDGSIYVRA